MKRSRQPMSHKLQQQLSLLLLPSLLFLLDLFPTHWANSVWAKGIKLKISLLWEDEEGCRTFQQTFFFHQSAIKQSATLLNLAFYIWKPAACELKWLVITTHAVIQVKCIIVLSNFDIFLLHKNCAVQWVMEHSRGAFFNNMACNAKSPLSH